MVKEEYKKKLVQLYNNGKDLDEICGEYNVPKSTFYRWIRQYQREEPRITEEDVKVLVGRIAALEAENATIKKVLYLLNKDK